jgi:hypothetical protein
MAGNRNKDALNKTEIKQLLSVIFKWRDKSAQEKICSACGSTEKRCATVIQAALCKNNKKS